MRSAAIVDACEGSAVHLSPAISFEIAMTCSPKTDPRGLKKGNGLFWASATKEAAMRKSKCTEEQIVPTSCAHDSIRLAEQERVDPDALQQRVSAR